MTAFRTIYPQPWIGYIAVAGALKRRLELQGFGVKSTLNLAARYLDEQLKDPESYIAYGQKELHEGFANGRSLLRILLGPAGRKWRSPGLQIKHHSRGTSVTR